MSVGNVAQSVWSVSGRSGGSVGSGGSAAVDWDKQCEQQSSEQTNQTNQSHYSHYSTTRNTMKISRCLFGPTNQMENKRMAYEETDNKRFSDRNRWNFDFYREKPISGRFDWKRVNNNEMAKSFVESGEQSDNLWSKKKSAKS